MRRFLLIFLLLILHGTAFAADAEALFTQGIQVNLREPEYCEGVLKTEMGGIITGPDMRVQARSIIYTRKVIDGEPVMRIEAEGDLFLEFGCYVFVGERLEYDFQTHQGIIINGRTAQEPWYFGGSVITLEADGSYTIYDGFVTTSENYKREWDITAREANVDQEHLLKAKDVKFNFFRVPLFWLPSFKANLDSIFDSPIRYSLRWGGSQGTRLGMIYEIFSWESLKTFLRVDYRFKRGLGAGFETYWHSADRKSSFETINYVAQDSSIVHPHENIRYRFQGVYKNLMAQDRFSIYASWDKLSDKDMPTDYNDRGLELDTAGRTELHLRYAGDNQISNLYSRVRINSFQTVEENLPTLQTWWLPPTLMDTGIISNSNVKASFLDFKYSKGLINVHDYHSGRIECVQKFYRPIPVGTWTLTPEAGGTAVFYSNSPASSAKWVLFGEFGGTLNTRLHRYMGNCKHVVIPYLQYRYLTYPTTSPNDHYIFDIEDGLYRLNMMTMGVQQNFYMKMGEGIIRRALFTELYAHAFFHTKTIHAIVPKIYGNMTFNSFSNLRHIITSAWDIERNHLDHFNLRTEWTLSDDFAIAAEYRHRDAFDWRKVDKNNFILDSFRPVHQLLNSELSDRRDTLLVNFFYRLNPCWAIQMESRQGWNRVTEPNYSEYEIDLLGTLRSAWHIKISYRHREDDDRISVNMSVGLRRPDQCCGSQAIPLLPF